MKQKKKSLLWQIEHPAVDRPSFLFGTMHVRDQQAFSYLQTVYAHLQQCDALAAEYDLSRQATPDLSAVLRLPPGQSLADFFSPAQYQKLQRILLKSFQIDIRFFQHFTPLLLINLITEQLLQQDHPQALDLQLWQSAGEMGKDRLGIETLEEQMAVLQQIPLGHQVKLLRSLGRNVSRFRQSVRQSPALYSDADPQQLYRSVRRSTHGLRHLLLFRRNHIMAERIEALIRQQPTLCAIGAGHLAGKEGVIRLLKLRGFKLRPIPLV
ncbi:MAG: TraB/GumN family protein [Saprospiraceae bacterium]|nr:TraB/GumN family protein [Lewinella sp.]